MRICVYLLFMLVATQSIAGPAWRWVDADGTVHYSDRPVPGAVEVYLPDAATRAPAQRAAPAGTPAATPAPASVVPVGESAQYTRLAISSPAPEETLWNLGGELTVTVDVAPALQQGHRLTLYYDGELVNAPANGNSFQVSEVFRGIHTVQAVIVDARNMQVLRSLPVEFVVQQTSIQNPQRR